MKPQPEELEDTTTPAITAELDAAAREFYESTDYPEGSAADWRQAAEEEGQGEE